MGPWDFTTTQLKIWRWVKWKMFFEKLAICRKQSWKLKDQKKKKRFTISGNLQKRRGRNLFKILTIKHKNVHHVLTKHFITNSMLGWQLMSKSNGSRTIYNSTTALLYIVIKLSEIFQALQACYIVNVLKKKAKKTQTRHIWGYGTKFWFDMFQFYIVYLL